MQSDGSFTFRRHSESGPSSRTRRILFRASDAVAHRGERTSVNSARESSESQHDPSSSEHESGAERSSAGPEIDLEDDRADEHDDLAPAAGPIPVAPLRPLAFRESSRAHLSPDQAVANGLYTYLV